MIPFRAVLDWIAWRRRGRQETIVAWAEYDTVSRTSEREVIASHFVTFYVDGNGLRYIRRKSSNKDHMETHKALLREWEQWRVFGDIPDHARRPSSHPKGKLFSITGGAA